MDARPPALRPRTRQGQNEILQAQGPTGLFPQIVGPVTRVQEVLLDAFPPDFPVGASQTLLVPLPTICTGFRVCNLTGTVFASINGQGARQIFDQDVISGANIRSLQVASAAASGATIQVFGYLNVPTAQ